MEKAALYIQGRIVLGSSHLDAFEQLTETEKSSSDIASGFFDEQTGEFKSYFEEEHFFNKEILLIRHGHTDHNDLDPALSPKGQSQVEMTNQLLSELNLDDFVGFCSPMLRCLQTADLISQATGINFQVKTDILEPPPFLSPRETFFLKSHHSTFPQYEWPFDNGYFIEHETNNTFLARVNRVLRGLPKKSMIVSHSGFVINMAKLALCNETVTKCGVPTASLTHIENREVRCLGENP